MDKITIIDNNTEAMDNYGYLYGAEMYVLTDEHIKALESGKILASDINDEYVIFISKEC